MPWFDWAKEGRITILYKHQWNTKWDFPRKLHILTREDNILSSHVKRLPSLWLHNKSCLWKQADLVFHWCLYNFYILAYGYEFYLLVFNSISHSFVAFTREISSWSLEGKIHIHARAFNILCITLYGPCSTLSINIFAAFRSEYRACVN